MSKKRPVRLKTTGSEANDDYTVLNSELIRKAFESAMSLAEPCDSGRLWRVREGEPPKVSDLLKGNLSADEVACLLDDLNLDESGIPFKRLWVCAADGMASGSWWLDRVTMGNRGYFVYTGPDDDEHYDGAVLLGWEPVRHRGVEQEALLTLYREWGDALSFPFCRTDIEIERIVNAETVPFAGPSGCLRAQSMKFAKRGSEVSPRVFRMARR